MKDKKDLLVVALRELNEENNNDIRFLQRRYGQKSASKAILTGISRIEELEKQKSKYSNDNMKLAEQIRALTKQIHRFMNAASIQKEMLQNWEKNNAE